MDGKEKDIETEVTETTEVQDTEVTEPTNEPTGSPFSTMLQSLILSTDDEERADLVSSLLDYDMERSNSISDLTNQITTANAERDDAIAKHDAIRKSNWDRFFAPKGESTKKVESLDDDVAKTEEQIMDEVIAIINDEESEGN